MSLRVDVFVLDEHGKRQFFDLGPGGHLAGHEALREELWGAEIMTTLGLTLLPALRYSMVKVSGDGLDALFHETEVILQNMELIVSHVGDMSETIRTCTGNFQHAVQRAKGIGGGVILW